MPGNNLDLSTSHICMVNCADNTRMYVTREIYILPSVLNCQTLRSNNDVIIAVSKSEKRLFVKLSSSDKWSMKLHLWLTPCILRFETIIKTLKNFSKKSDKIVVKLSLKLSLNRRKFFIGARN